MHERFCRVTITLNCIVILCSFGSLQALSQATTSQPAEREELVQLPLINGKVSKGDLFRVVADDVHWIAGTVAGFSELSNAVPNAYDLLSRQQVESLVERCPHVYSFVENERGQTVALQVNKSAMANDLANKKSQLRSWLAEVTDASLSSLDKVKSTWKKSSKPSRIVITMAGLHGFASSAEVFAEELHLKTGLPMCVFRYPNDAPLVESSSMLLEHLRTLHFEYPDSKITLVAHSMGGLVARWSLEFKDDDRKAVGSAGPVVDRDAVHSTAAHYGVDQLIQVCPPNHGSALAEYGPLLEGVEQLMKLSQSVEARRRGLLVSALLDGFNEAPKDLATESNFLQQLNACQRNRSVRYSILAGDDGPVRSRLGTILAGVWDQISDAVDEPEQLDRRLRNVLESGELRKGLGDGVVTKESARLSGVSDFEVLNMHHLTWSQPDTPAGNALIEAVSSRLGISL